MCYSDLLFQGMKCISNLGYLCVKGFWRESRSYNLYAGKIDYIPHYIIYFTTKVEWNIFELCNFFIFFFVKMAIFFHIAYFLSFPEKSNS